MTTPGGTPPSSGTDIAALGISVDTKDAVTAATDLDALGKATVSVVKDLDALIAKADQEAAAIAKSTAATKQKIEALNAEYDAQQAALELDRQSIAVTNAQTQAGMNLIAKLEDLNLIYGLTTEQVYRLRAAQLDVAQDAEPLIARLEQLKRAALESQVTQTRDLELWKERGKIYNEEQTAIARQIETQKARDIEINAARQKDIVSYTKWWEDQIVIQDAAIAKQESALLAFSLFKSRTLAENAAGQELPAAINGVSVAAKEGAEATNVLSNAFNNNRVRTEALVLAHEALQGRFTRMGGSAMVLVEYLNMSSVGMTGFTVTTLAAVAALGLFAYGVIRGIEQQKALNDALIRTNNIAGTTEQSLNALADSAGKVHGNFSQAYEAVTTLAKSGKFTSDQVESITKSVTGLYHAFGTPLQESIKEFESLAVKANTSGKSTTLEITKAVEVLDEKYHFLNTTTLERIAALEKEGKAQEAARIAIKAYSDESQRAAQASVDNAGWAERAWNQVTKAVRGTIQAMADVGKHATDAGQEQALIQQLPKNKDGSLMTDTNKMSVTDKYRFEEYLALEKKITDANEASAVQAEKVRVRSEANLAVTDLEIERAKQSKKSTEELTFALQNRWEVYAKIAAQNPNDPLLSQNLVNQDYLDIVREHTRKEKAVKDDGRKQELLAILDQATAEYNATVKANKENEKLDNEYYKQGTETANEYYANLKRARQDEMSAADREFEVKLAALNKYKARTAPEQAENLRKIQEVTNAHNASITAIEDEQSLSDAKQKTEADASYAAIIERTIKAGEAEQAVLQKTIAAQKLHNAEIGKTAEYKEKAKKQATEELTLQYESDAAYLDQLIASKQYDEQATAAYQARSTELHRIIELRKEDARLLQQGAQAEKEAAITKAAGEAWAKMDRKIEDDLISAIVDGGGVGVKKLIRDMEIAFAKLVLQPIIAPIASSIATLFNPNAPQATGAAGVAGAGSSIAGLINAANAAKTAYSALTSTGSGSIAAWLGGTSTVSPVSVAASNATGLAGGDSLGTLISMNGWSSGATIGAGSAAGSLGGGVTAGTGALGTGAAAGTGAELGTGLGGASSAGLGGGAAAGTGAELGTGLSAGAGSTLGGGAAAAGAGEGAAAGGAAGAGAEGSLATMGPYGWVALAVIAAFTLFGGGNGVEQNTNLKFANDNKPGDISINERGNQGQNDSYIGKSTTSEFGTFGVSSTFWMNADQSTVQDFIKTVGQTDDALAKFLTTTEKASVVTELQGKTYTAQTGAESDNPNAKGQLDLVFKARIHDIFEGIQTGLGSLIDSFSGTSSELATEAQNILSFRAALVQSGEAVFGEKVTLQQVAALRQPTESVGTALQRVSQEFITTNQVATNLGKTSEQVYGQVGLSSIKAREQLILLTGGLDQLTSQTSFYAQNFLSDADKLKPVTAAVDTALAALGITGVETKAQFKTLVQGLDLTKESDIKLFESLMQLAPAFATNADAVAAITTATNALNIELLKTQGLTAQATELERQQQLSTLSGTNLVIQQQIYKEQDLAAVKKLQISLLDAQYNKEASTAIQRADYLKSLDGVSQYLQKMIYSLQDAYQVGDDALAQLQKSIEAKRTSLNTQYDADKQAIQDSADLQKQAAEAQKTLASNTLASLNSVLSNVNSAIGSNSSSDILTMQQRQGALTTLNQSLGVVNSGGSAAQFEKDDTFNNALKTISKPSADLYSSFIDYSRDQAKANLVLTALKEKTSDQVDKNQKIVDAVSGVSTTIDSSTKAQLAALDKNHKADLDALDSLLKSGQDSLDSLKGIDTGIKSLTEAIANLQQAIAVIKGTQAQSNNDPAAAIKLLYETLLGRDPEAAGTQYWTQQLNNGASVQTIASDIMQSDEYKKLHPSSTATAPVTTPTVSPSGVPSSVVAPPIVSTPPSTQPTAPTGLEALYESVLGRTGDSAGIAYWTEKLSAGVSLDAIKSAFMSSAEYKKLHGFADGINEVPYDMTARIHEGERIMPKADNRELMSAVRSSSNNGALVEEVKSMRLEIQGLRKENNDLTLTLVQSNANISKLATRWEGQGIPVRAVDPTQPIEVRTVV